MLSYCRLLAIQSSVFFLALITLELILSLTIGIPTHEEFRRQQPEPYQGASFFSQEFIDESFFKSKWVFDPQTGVVKPQNFSGEWLNVENNLRRTINKSPDASRTVYLFGGSTVYNSEVPDEFTIASQLSEIIPLDQGLKVLNLGASSVHASQQLARLKNEVNLDPQDIVIFYDGVNNVQLGVVYQNKKGYMYGQPKQENMFIGVLRLLENHSSIIYLIMRSAYDQEVKYPLSLIDSTVDDYVSSLHEANLYTKSKGAKFYHFLQPTIFTKAQLNDYEKNMIHNGLPLIPKTSKKALQETYPLMKERLKELNFSHSLTNSFDHLDVSPYLDFCHVNHIGNKVIAENIWRMIAEDIN